MASAISLTLEIFTVSYSMDYSGDRPAQAGHLQQSAPPDVTDRPQAPRRRKRFVIPAILKTAATIAVTAVVFFGVERYGPIELRPSTNVGTYNARLVEAEKAAELRQQAKYEAWASQVKVSVEEQVEQYKAFNQGSLARYQAALERGKLLAQATTQIQSQYVAARISQAQVAQGGDQSVVNLARLYGRVMNGIQPGAGDSALGYSERLSTELSTELTDAATKGVTISVEGWDTGLPTVEELQLQIQSMKPIEIPPPPKMTDDPVTDKGDR